MSYNVNGKTINFSQNDFLAKGGQGSIFVKGSMVYKIYTDHSEMFTKDKMNELSVITDNRVIIPKDFIYEGNTIVGFTMNYTPDTIPLIKLFNTGYRDKANFSESDTVSIIEKMQETIQHIHDNKILQIDGNELNYLVGDSLKNPYFIDVDSYQTKNHKATVIMPSIRDWQAKQFSTLTDWYSFGIIACQLFIGLHPYKGRHPGYKRDLKQRALDNVSIFNKDVTVPKAVRDFSNIPSEYMNWFIDVFEKGKRIPPPLVAGTMILKPTVTVVSGSNMIAIEEITWYNKEKLKSYIETNWNNQVLNVSIENRKLLIKGKDVDIKNLCCSELMIANNNAYAKDGNKLYEVSLMDFNGNTIPKVNTLSIAKYSSKVMDGFIYQDLLGKDFLSIPYKNSCFVNVKVDELKDYKVIDGKYESKIAILICLNKKTNLYDKLTFVFNENHNEYVLSIIEDVAYYINFTVLENGIVLEITRDGYIEVTFNKINRQIKKEVNDKIIGTDWRLMHEGTQAMFEKNGKVFKFKMN